MKPARLLFASLATGAGLLLLIRRFEDFFIFWPDRRLGRTPADEGLPFEEVHLAPAPGARVAGWFVPHPSPRGVVLYLEGNGGSRSDRVGFLRLFYDLGLSSLIIDYEGYPGSTGKPSEANVYRDARAARSWLLSDVRTRDLPLVLYGESLGGAVAIDLAADQSPQALIVASTFSSMPEMVDRVCWGLPVSRIFRSRYHSLEKIARLTAPVLIFHGDADHFIPIEHGRRLAAAVRSTCAFLEIPGAGHECEQVLEGIGTHHTQALSEFLDHSLCDHPHQDHYRDHLRVVKPLD